MSPRVGVSKSKLGVLDSYIDTNMPSARDSNSYVGDTELNFQLHFERPTIPYVNDVIDCLVNLFTKQRLSDVNVAIPTLSIVPWNLG